ncbi:MAG: hypothetical protein V3T53_00175 [Phycisphaerales bacterium]
MPMQIALYLVLLIAASTRADVVERRGSVSPVAGEITRIDDAGVTVRSDLGAFHFVPWDRVRRVEAKDQDPLLAGRMETARRLWRARSRVERHDTTLAEPILERLFERYRGQTHETALVVAEGLLRCRLARGDHVRAVLPALETARLRRAEVTTDSYANLTAVIDESRSLCPLLAPAWLASPLLAKLQHDLGEYDAHGDEIVAAIASLYRKAIQYTLGESAPEAPSPAWPDHAGVKLLRGVVACGAVDAKERQTARIALVRQVAERPAWAEAWTRLHIGLSLVGETGIGRQQQGIVSLLHVPARFANSQPYLTGLALAYAAKALEATGDSEGAASLRVELRQTLPNHPVHAVDDTSLRLPAYTQQKGSP